MLNRRIPVFRFQRSGTCLLVVWLENHPAHNLPDMSRPPHTNFGAIQSKDVGAYSAHTHTHRQINSKYKDMIYVLWPKVCSIIWKEILKHWKKRDKTKQSISKSLISYIIQSIFSAFFLILN